MSSARPDIAGIPRKLPETYNGCTISTRVRRSIPVYYFSTQVFYSISLKNMSYSLVYALYERVVVERACIESFLRQAATSRAWL